MNKKTIATISALVVSHSVLGYGLLKAGRSIQQATNQAGLFSAMFGSLVEFVGEETYLEWEKANIQDVYANDSDDETDQTEAPPEENADLYEYTPLDETVERVFAVSEDGSTEIVTGHHDKDTIVVVNDSPVSDG